MHDHVERYADGYGDVHGGMGFGTSSTEGTRRFDGRIGMWMRWLKNERYATQSRISRGRW